MRIRTVVNKVVFSGAIGIALMCTKPVFAADQWIAPTPEELKMTSEPHAPGASAILLNYEESTEDELSMFSKYVRLKVLTEEGRKYADVELAFRRGGEGMAYSVDDVQGRTIHPDGTIVPFTGKPYEKLISRDKSEKRMAKVFTLPDVQVGSIIEYRYKERWDDNWYLQPVWFLQQDMFVRHLHFVWKPSNKQLNFSDGRSNSRISWTPILPPGVTVKETNTPSPRGSQLKVEVSADNLEPIVEEAYMPPMASFAYRVHFYYANYPTSDAFWNEEGKNWSKRVDHFIGNSSTVKTATAALVSGAATPEEKLKKIYTAVMEMENTDFTRQRTQAENKSAGLKEVKSAEDILARKRGSGDELAMLFIAMARSAGIKTYAMGITNRSQRIFFPPWLSMAQIDDVIAIAEVDGKERYFDPGQKYCPFGHLYWIHTYSGGIRQTDKGVQVVQNPAGDDYKYSQVQRVADLTLKADGSAEGSTVMTFMGSPAVRWRQRAARTDETELKKGLKESLEEMLPAGMEVEVTKIEQLEAYEQPLRVSYKVSGPIGTVTSKRMITQADIFEAQTKPMFPGETRVQPVYFPYEVSQRDVVKLRFPAGMKLEAPPTATIEKLGTDSVYQLQVQTAPDSVLVRRDLFRNGLIYVQKDYSVVRGFYNKVQSKDQENVILQMPTVAAANDQGETGK